MKTSDIFYFVVGFILPTYQLLDTLIRLLGRLIKRLTVHSEEDAITYEHYKNRTMRSGHDAINPRVCQDGDCAKIA